MAMSTRFCWKMEAKKSSRQTPLQSNYNHSHLIQNLLINFPFFFSRYLLNLRKDSGSLDALAQSKIDEVSEFEEKAHQAAATADPLEAFAERVSSQLPPTNKVSYLFDPCLMDAQTEAVWIFGENFRRCTSLTL